MTRFVVTKGDIENEGADNPVEASVTRRLRKGLWCHVIQTSLYIDEVISGRSIGAHIAQLPERLRDGKCGKPTSFDTDVPSNMVD